MSIFAGFLWREGVSLNFTVFFDDPFWTGIFTLTGNGKVKFARVIFGDEPSDPELYEYFLKYYNSLEFFESQNIEKEKAPVKNPKRRQREISKELKNGNRIKKSYEAAKLSIQQSKKKEKQGREKIKRELMDNYKLSVKQEKHREKHKGH